jgi:hypothetical protein
MSEKRWTMKLVVFYFHFHFYLFPFSFPPFSSSVPIREIRGVFHEAR